MKCQKCGANNANTHVRPLSTVKLKNMICAVNVQRKWDTQTSSVTLRTNFRDFSEVSLATAFPQELRQHAVTSAEAHIPILQSRVM